MAVGPADVNAAACDSATVWHAAATTATRIPGAARPTATVRGR